MNYTICISGFNLNITNKYTLSRRFIQSLYVGYPYELLNKIEVTILVDKTRLLCPLLNGEDNSQLIKCVLLNALLLAFRSIVFYL